MRERQNGWLCMTGVFLTLLGIYALTAPGRIDMIDGQWRYEVARNWLDRDEPVVRDRHLLVTGGAIEDPRTGKSYAVYNAAPSVTPMPFMLISRLLPGHTTEREHFAFSLAGPFFGALLGVLLMVAFRMLGIGLRQSIAGTALFCLATLWWPASLTVFDQNQHAFLILSATLLGWQSARCQSILLAGLAGLLGGLLFTYQESYGLLLPAMGLAVLGSPKGEGAETGAGWRGLLSPGGLRRYVAFGTCCLLGVGLFVAYNYARFGTPLMLSRFSKHTAWGDPIPGLLGLLVSPGKGVFWFSPPLLLALLGARGLRTRAPLLFWSVTATCAIHLLLIAHLAFFGGDWCWGPRYLVPIMPLLALALPFAAPSGGRCRVVACVATAGLTVQILGISLDHHRFYYERNYEPMYWADDPWVYFKQSQLIARPFELVHAAETDVPPVALRFSPTPSGQSTYCPFGPVDPEQSKRWVRHFRVFSFLRPWWGWMGRIEPAARPVNPFGLLFCCGMLLVPGVLLLIRMLRIGRIQTDSVCPSVDRAPAGAADYLVTHFRSSQ